MSESGDSSSGWVGRVGLWAGVALALLLGIAPTVGWELEPGRPELNAMAAVAALMAAWWLTDAAPMAVTALLPLALFPLLRIMPGDQVAGSYGNYIIFLFLGGFLIALAIEESGLHRRVALTIIAAMGDQPGRIVWGFMLATAVLSMWISNTATAMMMLPIATSVLSQADGEAGNAATRRNFGIALMLGIAYSASIGGIATLIGTPPNVAFKGFYEKSFPDRPSIDFLDWMILGVPFSAVMLVIAWLLLTKWVFPVGRESLLGGGSVIRERLRGLGRMSAAEWRMAGIFTATALLWIFREPVTGYGWAPLLEVGKVAGEDGKDITWANDGTVAMAMAILCFLIPAGRPRDGEPAADPGAKLLSWEATTRVPWGLLLLFGGGLALASGMSATALDKYLGDYLAAAIGPLPEWAQVTAVAFGMTWLTELTSNLASVNMILPILAKTAGELGIAPLVLMLPATLAASCAFMLPVATPPNAIVYASGRLKTIHMVKAGIWLNLAGIAVTALLVLTLRYAAFGAAALEATR